MSAAPDLRLLAEIQAAGLSVESREAGRVRLAPRERLTPELRARIVASKPALLAAMDLARRIRDMAARWQFAADELGEALAAAESDPPAWLAAVAWDEELTARAKRSGLRWPI